LGELETVDEQVEKALQDERPPGNKREHAYSDMARCFFAKIKILRSRGFSFVQICNVALRVHGKVP
jgi:hypothetical protein